MTRHPNSVVMLLVLSAHPQCILGFCSLGVFEQRQGSCVFFFMSLIDQIFSFIHKIEIAPERTVNQSLPQWGTGGAHTNRDEQQVGAIRVPGNIFSGSRQRELGVFGQESTW